MRPTTMRGNRLGRLGVWGGGGGALALAALLVLSPLSAGATVIHAPYKSFGKQTFYGIGLGGCGKVKGSAAVWAAPTATLHASGTATAPACKPSASINMGEYQAQASLSDVMKFKTAGSHNISSAWAFKVSDSWTTTPYTGCKLNYAVAFSTCVTTSEVELYTYSYLYDQNNGSYFNFGTFLNHANYTTQQNYSQNYCYGGTCTHYGGNTTFGGPPGSFTGTMTGATNITVTGATAVNAKDSYQLWIVLVVFVIAEAYIQNAVASGVGTAAASVNLATLGNGATLTSVTVQ